MDLFPKPQLGEMYRCENCRFEIHVTASCDCEHGCASLVCCGKPMKNVTSPPTQEVETIDDSEPGESQS